MIEIDFKKKLNGGDGVFDLALKLHIEASKLVTIYRASGAGKI